MTRRFDIEGPRHDPIRHPLRACQAAARHVAALNFIDYVSHRYQSDAGRASSMETAAFISRFAGTLGDDFPNDIDESDLGLDHARETLE